MQLTRVLQIWLGTEQTRLRHFLLALVSGDVTLLGFGSYIWLLQQVLSFSGRQTEHSCQAPSQTLIRRQTVRKLKKGFENRLNHSTSPIGVSNNNNNDLVFSHTLVSGKQFPQFLETILG